MKSIKSIRIPDGIVRQLKLDGVVLWKQDVLEQLTAPTISLDGDTLTMTATDDRTQEFVIFVDGVEKATVQAGGGEQPDTPDIPDTPTGYTVSGTWYFDSAVVDTYLTQQVNFTSNGESFASITVDNRGDRTLYYGSTLAWSGSPVNLDQVSKWINEDYRTITFDGTQTVSKEFYEWFVANATRQTISFTISIADGSGEVYDPQTLTVQSGITWREWVETTDYTHLDTKPTIVDNIIMINEGDLYRLKDMPSYSSGNYISPDEVIQPNTVYYFVTYSK